jgi:branched-chain amino acid transport system permease protein
VNLVVNAIATGLAIGSVYGLIAIGYTVVFNATRVFNLAQGDLVMVGVLLSYWALDLEHWPQLAAFGFVLVGVVVVSLFEERVVVRPFLRRPAENIGWFISTLAFSLIVETIATILYGNHPPEPVPSPLSGRAVHLGTVTISPQLLLAIVTLLVVTAAVELFYRGTWLGQAMRATAEDREVAALRGIDPARMSTLAFGIGGLVAAVGGFVIAPVVFSDVSIGLAYGLKGFIALAIGGFGSLRGAVIGAFALGAAEQVFDLYVSPRYEILAALALLMAVLALRPTGLFGETGVRRV